MDTWVRNLVMIVTLTVWAVVVLAYVAQGKLPDAPILGVPGAVYLAVSPAPLGKARDAIARRRNGGAR